jgi:hypothetical protein
MSPHMNRPFFVEQITKPPHLDPLPRAGGEEAFCIIQQY